MGSKSEEQKTEILDHGMPGILSKNCAQHKLEERLPLFTIDPLHDNHHKVEKMKAGVHEKYCAARLALINKIIPKISTNWCNYGQSLKTIDAYKSLISAHFGKLTPLKLRVDCYLYHGGDYLVDEDKSRRKSHEIFFNNNIYFNQWIDFELKYCQMPEKTRLSFNIVLIFEEKNVPELVIGTVSTNLFNKQGQFQSGRRELNIWPFYQIDERLGCMKEYNGLTTQQAKTVSQNPQLLHLYFSRLLVYFEVFINPMYYSSRDDRKIERFNLTRTKEDNENDADSQG